MQGSLLEPTVASGFLPVLNARAAIHPDGGAVRITFATPRGKVLLGFSFDRISAVDTELRQAGLLMLYRQTRALNQSYNPLDDLVRTALTPCRVTPLIDRASGDRIFVQEFPDRMPVVTRMTAEAVIDSIHALQRATSKAAS